MINKNIKKILNTAQINEISQLNLNARPSEINEEMYYKLLNCMRKLRISLFTLIISSICLKQLSRFLFMTI